MNELYMVGDVDKEWADGYFVVLSQGIPYQYYLTTLNRASIFYTNEGAEKCRSNAQLVFPALNLQIFKYILTGGYKPHKHNDERRLDTEL